MMHLWSWCSADGGRWRVQCIAVMSSQEAAVASFRLVSCGEAIRVLTASLQHLYTHTVCLSPARSTAPHFTVPLLSPHLLLFCLLPMIISSQLTFSIGGARCVFSSSAAIICHGPPCVPVFRHSGSCSLVFSRGSFRSLVGGLAAAVISARSHCLYLLLRSTDRTDTLTCLTYIKFTHNMCVCVCVHGNKWCKT